MQNNDDHYVFEFILSDEQKDALTECCEEILNADSETAALCYFEVFGVEPTNKDLYAFCALLKQIYSEKTNTPLEDFNQLRVIEGGKGKKKQR